MSLRLRYSKPAAQFNEAMPIGNGRLGAMIFGRPWQLEDYYSERIPLNEETIWFGGPTHRENPDAVPTLGKVRRLLAKGKVPEAEFLADIGLTATPRNGSPYQALGELVIASEKTHVDPTNYRRELDLETGIATVAYTAGRTRYEAESFASAPANVLVFHFHGTGTESLSFQAYLRRRPFDGEAFASGRQTVGITGQAGPNGVHFAAALTICVEGGSLDVVGQSLHVRGARSATFYIASWTTFRKADPRRACLATLRKAVSTGYRALREEHIQDHRELFGRVKLRIGKPPRPMPTDKRLEQFRKGASDPDLYALRFQFGRYLLMGSSRPGCLPANLQGIWCDSMMPIWNCNYTLNVNLQMNYWPAETTALPECHKPLFDFLTRMVARGKQTARQMYACRGFVAHHTSDMWADTAPTGGVYASALWPLAGAWLALHAWEHFRFGGDVEFLRRVGYPILREAARFFQDFLVENERGELVAVPSVSPENFYALPGGGKGKLCAGAAMDSQILRELFEAAAEAAACLGRDAGERRAWQSLRDRLPPIRKAAYGGIQEWENGCDELDPGHRHLSPLFALFPGTGISPLDASAPLAKAAATTLRRKLRHRHDRTGWCLTWMAHHFARLLDGKSALACLREVVTNFTHPSLMGDCPPLNLDNNFGFSSAVAEMLLQSHRDELHLLPALPPEWPEGEVTGLRARGGASVSLSWNRGTLREAIIRSDAENVLAIRSPVELQRARGLAPLPSDGHGHRYLLHVHADRPIGLRAQTSSKNLAHS